MRHQALHDKLIEVHVPLDALKKWRSTKSSTPKACDVAMQSRRMPETHPAFQEEHQRAMVIVALRAAYEKHACNVAVAEDEESAEEAIRLVPMGTIAKHKGKEPTKAIHINAFGHQWTITAPKQNSMFEDDKLPLVPFFWVRPAPSDEEANMAWSVIKQDDMSIPQGQEPTDSKVVENREAYGRRRASLSESNQQFKRVTEFTALSNPVAGRVMQGR
ncbi:unnamed protein product [Symbiodinium microadriaticum]|nr:unnamed protein product [Symbiodinium microadriaticum]CAE7347556.1 unnamed protein product [Symbiodinium sp. KB8]